MSLWNCGLLHNFQLELSPNKEPILKDMFYQFEIYFQIALRAAFLEKENSTLKEEVKKVTSENKKLAAEKEALQQQLKALTH